MLDINTIKHIGLLFMLATILQVFWISLFGFNVYRLITRRPISGGRFFVIYPIVFLTIALLQVYISASSYLSVIKITGQFDIFAAMNDMNYIFSKIKFCILYACITTFGLMIILVAQGRAGMARD